MRDLAAAPSFSHEGDCNCIDFACNDDGDGGICTHCGELHTVTIVSACVDCSRPTTGADRMFCTTCVLAMGKR